MTNSNENTAEVKISDDVEVLKMTDYSRHSFRERRDWGDRKVSPQTVLELRAGMLVYESDGKWGFAWRNLHGTLDGIGEPEYDTIYQIGDLAFAAKKESDWYFVDGARGWSSRCFHDLEDLLRHSHFEQSLDAALFEDAKAAIQPDEIVKRVPRSQMVVFRQSNGWGIGHASNRYVSAGHVIPLARFDDAQITVVQQGCSDARSWAIVGSKEDRWIVRGVTARHRIQQPEADQVHNRLYSADVGHTFDRRDQAIHFASRSVGCHSHVGRISPFDYAIPVDDLECKIYHYFVVFRLGSHWGVGRPSHTTYCCQSEASRAYVLPVASGFTNKDIEFMEDLHEDAHMWPHIIGQSDDHWKLYNHHGNLLGEFASREEADQWVSHDHVPDPIGTDFADPLNENVSPPLELERDERSTKEPESVEESSETESGKTGASQARERV